VSEYWNGPFTSLSVEITKEQFEKMKAQIEHDQINGDHTYQVSISIKYHKHFTNTCTSYSTVTVLNMLNLLLQ
jgi:hypothetical protein